MKKPNRNRKTSILKANRPHIYWGAGVSPYGICALGRMDAGICHLSFHSSRAEAAHALRVGWPDALLERDDDSAGKAIARIFSKKEKLPVLLHGTEFQLQVWQQLLAIPEGSVTTYSRIAAALGRPHASRAVGAACGANPVAWIVPCHRVISASGRVNGYRWGAERKLAMLAAEAGE